MAAYETVVWQPGDEVTSQKLQQMCNNDEYMKENSLVGDIQFLPSALGAAPAGREPGIVRATRVCGLRVDFDSQVPVIRHLVTVSLSSLGFTEAPVIASSYNVDNHYSIAHLTIADRLDMCRFHISERNGQSVRIKGNIHLVCIGR